MAALLDSLISTISALAGITAYNGHVYKGSALSGTVLVTVQRNTPILEGLAKDEVERPFQLKLYAKDQTSQDTFLGLIKPAINVGITDGFWKIYDEVPDYTESRRNIILYGKQIKVE